MRDMCAIAFEHVGLVSDDYITIDPSLFRPAEWRFLLAIPRRPNACSAGAPRIPLETMIREMVDADLARLRVMRLNAIDHRSLDVS